MAVQTNATLLAIQNMTWYGQLGFQTAPSQPINIPYLDLQYNPQWEAGSILGYPFTLAGDAQGVMGIQVGSHPFLSWRSTFHCRSFPCSSCMPFQPLLSTSSSSTLSDPRHSHALYLTTFTTPDFPHD